MTAIPTKAPKPSLSQRMKRLAKQYWKYRYLMLLLIPSVAMLIIFKYIPMYGVTIAFKNFKLRQGMPIGAKVTLRSDRMWEFFDRLTSIAIPRIRDFRGIPSTSFDGRGNFSLGVTEQLIFPEIDYDKVDKTRGMDITIVTTAKTDEEAKALLEAFGFPFKK